MPRTHCFTLYQANCLGNPTNNVYPHAIRVTGTATLQEAVCRDYVCAQYKDGRRSNQNFIQSDCLALECDNTHSENPEDWVTPQHLAQVLPDVFIAIHYSRNHMKTKGRKAPRPRFHVFIPIDLQTDVESYKRLKQLVHQRFPFFDENAMDAARFFFGTAEPVVEIVPGTKNLSEFLEDEALEQADAWAAEQLSQTLTIPEGNRNATMSVFAAKVLKRLGDTEEAHQAFLNRADCCVPPLEDEELDGIWRSAQGFFQRIAAREDYILPEEYGDSGFVYHPTDCTDVGQARLLGKHYGKALRYSPATDFIRYIDGCWQETKPGARAVAHELTDRQLEEAEAAVAERYAAYEATGAAKLMSVNTKKKAVSLMNEEQLAAYEVYSAAERYRSYALNRRESKHISATLKEAEPVLEIDPAVLDKHWYLLCTPEATYDLRKGIESARSNNPEDFITHKTSVSPGDEGAAIWQDALNTFFCGDQELIHYVQCVAGIVCAGQVFLEAMIIAYGDGRNGKSTFWNTLSRIMGSYSGNISADSLTVQCRRNVKPEMAEARGKRLLIAAEMEEGMRLSTSTVKQLTSTDNVFAEKKYKDPFAFTPSHTLVLYTNHLPKIGAKDEGIWRRLIVIPFSAKIEGKSDIKNYTDYLFKNAGPAIMKWMIEGAQMAWKAGFKLKLPAVVRQAVEAYRDQNDWLGAFLDERCKLGNDLTAKSGALYQSYRSFCMEMGEYTRSTSDFYSALEHEGFSRKRTREGSFITGLSLKTWPDFLD